MRYGEQQRKCFIILGHFLPFYPTNNLENQNSEKMKKTPRGITILHISTINGNLSYMVTETWSLMERFSCHFGPFPPLLLHPNNPENQNFEKNEKNALRYYFTCVYHK